MKRKFRYSADSNMALRSNPLHNFALQHCIKIYEPNAAYAFIPKNGCSTLRLSIAIANGLIESPSQVDWVHANNDTFSMTTESAFLADYTFAILRCPFRRLYSAFFDKMVNLDQQSWRLCEQLDRKMHPHEVTFSTFVTALTMLPHSKQNKHWRRQVDFLVYDDYDDYFRFEDFDFIAATLKEKIGLDISDSRAYLKHETESIKKTDRVVDAFELSAIDLLNMKKNNALPTIASMYNEKIISDVKKLYEKDINLYSRVFGSSGLQFS